MSSYYNPVKTYFGIGRIDELPGIISSCKDVKRILLLTRGGSFDNSNDQLRLSMLLKDYEMIRIPFSVSNPDISDIVDLRRSINSRGYDLVIAVGGGSVLDAAKAIVLLKDFPSNDAGDIRRLIKDKEYAKTDLVKWVAVPTTAGTGSEVTPWATIWDRENSLKYSIESEKLFAYAAVIDPELTRELPYVPSMSSAFDSLCHAFEAYWAKSSGKVQRMYALFAIEILIDVIPKLSADIKDMKNREKTSLGSFLAGMAFSNTKTTACHSISYPLTLKFGIDHGIAAVMTLPEVLRINRGALVDKDKILMVIGVDNIDQAADKLTKMLEDAGFSPWLIDHGVKEEDICDIVQASYSKGRMDNNPVDIPVNELDGMLRRIYEK
jgi:phosphonate metabolism-associated iron-containing alcohol dehydrogenase